MVLYVRFAINQYSRYPNLITCYCFLTRRQDVTCLFIDIFCWFSSMAFVALKHTTLPYYHTMTRNNDRLKVRAPFFHCSKLEKNVKTHYARLVNFLFYLFVRASYCIRLPKFAKFLSSTYFE